MAISLSAAPRVGTSALIGTQDLVSSPDLAFGLICEVEKWPVWLSFVRSARFVDEDDTLRLGAVVALRGMIPGEEEELYEVDQFLDGFIVSLVGAFSVRRRIDFRIERKSETSKLVVRVDYPSYGGVLGALVDRMTARRKIDRALGDSLVHFKGLVEFKTESPDNLLADF